MVYLLAAEQAPLTIIHIACRYHSNQTASQPAKNDERQPAVKRFSQTHVEFLTSSPDLIVAGKDFFDFIGGVLVPLDMEDVIVVPQPIA